MKSFDLLVIGAGTAATSAANKSASARWSVAVVDELPYGGTCALRGCNPKKMLDENEALEYAMLQSNVRESSGFRYLHRIEYVESDRISLSVEVFGEIAIGEQALDLADEIVAH